MATRRLHNLLISPPLFTVLMISILISFYMPDQPRFLSLSSLPPLSLRRETKEVENRDPGNEVGSERKLMIYQTLRHAMSHNVFLKFLGFCECAPNNHASRESHKVFFTTYDFVVENVTSRYNFAPSKVFRDHCVSFTSYNRKSGLRVKYVHSPFPSCYMPQIKWSPGAQPLLIPMQIKLISLAIALFTVSFSHLHYNAIYHVCEAISGYFVVLTRNCLAPTLDYIVMQMRKTNREKGCC